MSKKQPKVLFVATSRQTMGGITSVLKRYEKMEFWKQHKCAWLETQVNKGMALKLWYMIKAYITMLFIVPFYNIIHFHTVPGRSITMQMPVFLYSLLWRKKTIIHIHVGNQLHNYKNDRSFNFVLRHATKVIVLADVLKKLMKEDYNIDADVIYNPIEEQPIRNINETEKYIFFAAMLRPFKGYETLLKAYKEVFNVHKEWKLVIAGSGDNEKVEAIAKELDIERNITVYKWRTREEMGQLYCKAGIFCIASKMEGFPMTFLEAASHGVPIVTTPVGGVVDVIKNEENCMVFNFDDHKGLAKQINRLIDDNELRKRISENLVKLTKEKFSYSSVQKRLENIYTEIIDKK